MCSPIRWHIGPIAFRHLTFVPMRKRETVCNLRKPQGYIFLLEMKQGQCIYPLSWSIHCKYTGDGKCMVNVMKRGWACTPHPQQPGLIFYSWLNVWQNAVTTLCTLWRKALGRRAPHPPRPPNTLPHGGHCSPGNSLTVFSSLYVVK
jgi:hypothetical protein